MATTFNRLKRAWSSHPWPVLANMLLLLYLAWATQPTGRGSAVMLALVFFAWGATKGSRQSKRERDKGCRDLLLTTGLAPHRMMLRQTLASMLSLSVAIPTFWVCCLPFMFEPQNPQTWTPPLPMPVSVVLTLAIPLVCAWLGAALGVLGGYQVHIEWPQKLCRSRVDLSR